MMMMTVEQMQMHDRVHELTETLVGCVTDLAAKLAEDDPPEVVQAALYNAGVMLAPRTRSVYYRMPRGVDAL